MGEGFHFDAAMRDYCAETDGHQTLADALEHDRTSRGHHDTSIGEQFEHNRFTRAWDAEHPGRSHDEFLAAWQRYRSLPVDERGRIRTPPAGFPGAVGKTSSQDDFSSLLDDVETHLFAPFDDDTVVWPGHGDPTTIGAERPHLDDRDASADGETSRRVAVVPLASPG